MLANGHSSAEPDGRRHDWSLELLSGQRNVAATRPPPTFPHKGLGNQAMSAEEPSLPVLLFSIRPEPWLLPRSLGTVRCESLFREVGWLLGEKLGLGHQQSRPVAELAALQLCSLQAAPHMKHSKLIVNRCNLCVVNSEQQPSCRFGYSSTFDICVAQLQRDAFAHGALGREHESLWKDPSTARTGTSRSTSMAEPPSVPAACEPYSFNIPSIFHQYSINIPSIFHQYSINIPSIFHESPPKGSNAKQGLLWARHSTSMLSAHMLPHSEWNRMGLFAIRILATSMSLPDSSWMGVSRPQCQY